MCKVKKRLLDRQYNEIVIDTAINKARKIPRKFALKKVVQPNRTEVPVFVITYDPRLHRFSLL